MSAPAAHCPAWVLHRRPYGETGALVELFTREHGRLGAVARGAQRRGWGGLLEPFVPLHAAWRGRGELKTITDLEQAGAGYRLRGEALACGFYMAELLLAMTRREDPHPRTWEAYAVGLDALTGHAEPALRRFELALLAESGYGLRLEEDVHGAPIAAERPYRYAPERGPEPLDPGEAGGACVHGATLLALAAGEGLAEEPVRSEARRLLRTVLNHRLGGRRLRSRELFRSFRKPHQ